jgi:hypothetical protein
LTSWKQPVTLSGIRLVQRQQAEVNRIMEPQREAARARMQAYAEELHAQMQEENAQNYCSRCGGL